MSRPVTMGQKRILTAARDASGDLELALKADRIIADRLIQYGELRRVDIMTYALTDAGRHALEAGQHVGNGDHDA